MSIPTTFTDNSSPDLEAAVLNTMQRKLMEVAVTASATASYTLALADAGSCVEIAHPSSALAVIVPANATVPFPIGTVIEVARMDDGTVGIFADTGVTIRSRSDLRSIASKYSSVSLRKRAADDWHLVGDLS